MNVNEIDILTAPKKARVEIIPLIDVIFFLLATFVLFTLSLNKIGVIDVRLPDSRPDPNPTPDATVSIQASVDGALYWKQGTDSAELITIAELRPKLEQYRRNVPGPRVFIRGDNRAKFGATARILDIVRAAGIDQVAIETKASPTGS